MRVSESPQSDHASEEAARGVIPPIPLPRSLAPSITTPLYSATVCQALRQPLQGGVVCELRRTPLRRNSPHWASVKVSSQTPYATTASVRPPERLGHRNGCPLPCCSSAAPTSLVAADGDSAGASSSGTLAARLALACVSCAMMVSARPRTSGEWFRPRLERYNGVVGRHLLVGGRDRWTGWPDIEQLC